MPSFTLPALAAMLATSASAQWWKPSPSTTWQIILQDPLQPPFPSVSAIDGDLFDTTAANWGKVKSAGLRAICYFSAGTYEEWRDDANQFQDSDLGSPLDDWPGERWLDTNSANVRRIMKARMDLARSVGCDAIDPDNVDAYDNDNGLDLTETDAIDYVKFLSSEGHSRGLAVGLKNAGALVSDVLPLVDFQVNEQCQQFKECADFTPFVKASKPVFAIEYRAGTPSQADVTKICNQSKKLGFSTLIKHLSLDKDYVACQ